MWSVLFLDEATAERAALSSREQVALQNAIEKLQVAGPHLGYPHSSNVVAGKGLRELRPRGGRSVTRAFYIRMGDVLVVAAIGPEAQHDRRGFKQAVADAQARLDQVEG